MSQSLLVMSSSPRDGEAICQVLSDAGVQAQRCADLDDVVRRLDECAAVVLTEEALSEAGSEVAALLVALARQPPWSDLPIIVLAPEGGTRSVTVDALGNAVLLKRPITPVGLGSAAQFALRARARQVAMHELLESLESRVERRTRALAATEARFRAVFEGFPEVLFVVAAVNDAFLLEGFNPAGERRLGVSNAAVAGLPPERLLDASQAELLTRELQRCVHEGRSVEFGAEFRFPSGMRTLELTLTPLREGGGTRRINRILGIARDVTERNILEARLQQARRLEALGQLTGGVAHDFNNLLQVVLSGLTLMERVQDPARRTQLAGSVRRAAQRGGELTKRLLTVARRQSLRPQPIDIARWFGDGAGDLLRRTLRGDIRTEVVISPGLPPVEADPTELELAVLNLAVNARDAMAGYGTLTIAAEAVTLDGSDAVDGLQGRFVRLSLSDTGAGMSADIQARVFEPFFTTKEVGQGTGLGLAQVYGFAKQSGGAVRLRSLLGQGTTVSLFLPVTDQDVAASPPPASGQPAKRRRASILVVEDDEDVAGLVVDMLAQLGHAPHRVATAAAALETMAEGAQLDLLFSDVLMPGGMDGLALARETARRRPGTLVLLTTGYTGGGTLDTPLGVPLLRKPYRLDELAAMLDKLLTPAPGPGVQAAVQPPSTGRTTPVVNDAASLAR